MDKDWVDDKVAISKLNLDLQNPRLPKHVKDLNNISLVRNYLLEKEGVLKIARSIANNGYHRSAVAITCEENGKIVVLDGNRRLAACQLLLDPSIAPNAKYINEFKKLNSILDKKQLDGIKITIAPSRKEAEKEIWDIHVNQLLKSWQVLQKLRMYRNLIDSGEYTVESASFEYGISKVKFEKELSKLYFYEQILENLPKVEDEEELLKSGFNKIDRLILSANGKKLLKYEINDKGAITVKNQKDFNNKMKTLIPFIVDPTKVNAQATQEELLPLIFNKIDPVTFSIQKTETKGQEVPKSTNTTEGKKATVGTLAERDWVTDKLYKNYTGPVRVKNMLKEMKSFSSLAGYENISAVSLRVLLELSLYSFLEANGHIKSIIENKKNELKLKNEKLREKDTKATLYKMQSNWSPSFKEMINFSINENNNVVSDPQKRESINALLKKQKTLTGFIDDLNLFIHNPSYTPTVTNLHDLWKKFGRLIFDIIK